MTLSFERVKSMIEELTNVNIAVVCGLSLLVLLVDTSDDGGCDPPYRSKTHISFDGLEGHLTVPVFTKTCTSDVKVVYTFEGVADQRVQLTLNNVSLGWDDTEHDTVNQCETGDFIKVHVFVGRSKQELTNVCGNRTFLKFMSTDNTMELEYVKRSSTKILGPAFSANYKFVTNFGITTGIQNKNQPNIKCMFEYFSSQGNNGTFSSPNYPGYYPRNTECHYIFHGSQHERIYISFKYFDVEGHSNCKDGTQSDYVELSNFNIPLVDRKMDRLCGTDVVSKRKEISSDGNFFRVTFKSDDVYDGEGFEAAYQFRKISSDQHMLPRGEKMVGRTSVLKSSYILLSISLLISPLHS
ncbi:hypothetical protein HELRODRAFT_188109 [Helobdella robusta]|uniref:CUB domain-containing protein n=1 Tax=Helobdella robusta TaxID=6412 RepID=T1FPN3_HELRO|nr:hypothetical protein HELRODRAFT_188109 [Helobdella robusta]ESO13111.1 hypothetical protein HELRODRAFT_188109 [Helobdella robusta]